MSYLKRALDDIKNFKIDVEIDTSRLHWTREQWHDYLGIGDLHFSTFDGEDINAMYSAFTVDGKPFTGTTSVVNSTAVILEDSKLLMSPTIYTCQRCHGKRSMYTDTIKDPSNDGIMIDGVKCCVCADPTRGDNDDSI